MSIDPEARVRLQSDVLMQRVGDESVLLNLKTELYFTLDEVGSDMITFLQESDSIAEARSKLLAKYEVDEATLTRDMTELVQECQDNGLLEVSKA